MCTSTLFDTQRFLAFCACATRTPYLSFALLSVFCYRRLTLQRDPLAACTRAEPVGAVVHALSSAGHSHKQGLSCVQKKTSLSSVCDAQHVVCHLMRQRLQDAADVKQDSSD